MNKIIFLLLLFFQTSMFACSCMNFGNQFDSFSNSDLVADVTVEKVYPAEKKFEKQYYKVDLRYNKIFKGTATKTIYVNGSITVGGKRYGSWTSCSLYLETGQRFIIFESKDKQGRYIIHYCSQRIKYEPNNLRKNFSYKNTLEILDFISNQDVSSNVSHYYVDFNFDSDTQTSSLDEVKGLKVKNNFAVFEITLNKDGSFKIVKNLQNFNSNKDQQIDEIVRKSSIKLNPSNKDKITDGERFLLLLFYYPSEKNNKSFVSQFFL